MFIILLVILLYKHININLLRNQKIKFMWIGVSIIILIQITLWDFSIYESSSLLPYGIIYADTNSSRDYINQVLTKAESMASAGENPPLATFLAAVEEDIGINSDFEDHICLDIWRIKFCRNYSKAGILKWFDRIFK